MPDHIAIEDDPRTEMPEASGEQSSPQKARRARGIDRVIEILEYLHKARRPLRLNEIAKGVGAPRSTVYDIAEHLLKARMLEFFDDDGRVFLGRKLYYLGLAYTEEFDLTREARKHLRALTETTGETSQLCMIEGDKYLVSMMNHGVRHFKISSDVGEGIPIPWTASGRLLLSHLPDREILDLIPAEDYGLPDGETLSPAGFLGQIREAGPSGFFSCDSVLDTFTHCFAASVTNERHECVATLCLVVPREDARRRYDELKRVLLDEAAILTRTLGGR